MLKLRSMIEDMAEKLLGRYLPQVEAHAGGCIWLYDGCCGVGGTQKRTIEVCNGIPTGNSKCEGHCPV